MFKTLLMSINMKIVYESAHVFLVVAHVSLKKLMFIVVNFFKWNVKTIAIELY